MEPSTQIDTPTFEPLDFAGIAPGTPPIGVPASQRWFGVGSSDHPDATTAGTAAIDAALTHPDPKLVLVLCSTGYDLDALVAAIAARAPGIPMIGCTTAGEIATGSAGDNSVVVTALGGTGFTVATRVAHHASEDLFGAGAAVAKVCHEMPESPHQVLLILADGLAGNQQDIVRGAYSEVGAAVPLVGGSAGDDSQMVKTFQIIDGEVTHDAIVAAFIGSDAPIGVGVRHGWRPVGEPMLVTNSDGTSVIEIDDRPALDAYLDRLGATEDLATDPAAFSRFAMTHPLGLRRGTIEEVRFVSGADAAARTLSSIAEVPQGSLVWIMEGDAESVLDGTTASCQEALEPLDGADPIGMLLFDCIARRGVLGDEGVCSEMETIAECIPPVPVAGFYTYGEFARTQGVRGFHNQTLVALAFG